MNTEVILETEITCPRCGASFVERMPTDACVVFYPCAHCNEVLRPMPGDCCVFCSYGTMKCPPIQMDAKCCT